MGYPGRVLARTTGVEKEGKKLMTPAIPSGTRTDLVRPWWKARVLAPKAKRALQVGWGDRSASRTILQACAFGELDNYLYKPWVPAEVRLYPLVSEFLAEWTRLHRPAMEFLLRRDPVRSALRRGPGLHAAALSRTAGPGHAVRWREE
jgi:hypothetical protein